MKKDLLYRALRTFIVLPLCALAVACGENNPDNPTPENNNPSNVFPAVVNIDYDKATVAVCDTTSGTYAIKFQGEVPTIKPGSVVLVKDGERHRIVLVTDSNTTGNRVDFSGPLGDLRYVFKNTKFTVKLGDEEGQQGDDIYYPVKTKGESTTKAAKPRTLWDEPYSNDFTLWELQPKDYPEWMIQIPTTTEEHADLTAHVEFDPLLTAELEFSFGDEITDIRDKVAFALAGAYDVQVKVNGDFHSSLDFNFNYKMDDVWDGIVHGGDKPRYFFDKTELLKHDLFHKDFVFVVMGVPFEVHAGCDLFTEMMMTMHGEANLTFGLENDIHFMASTKVSPYRDQILDYQKEFDVDWDGHEPVFSGKESVDLKWYLYPHLYFWIDFGAGPCLDIKPYASVEFGQGGRKNFSELESYDDFITWTAEGHVGLDCSVGISTPLENYFYEADLVTRDLGNIIDRKFLKTPSGLILNSEPGEIKAGKPVNLDFTILGDYYGKPATSWFPTSIKLDFPKSGGFEILFPVFGKASYTWTPKFEDDELVARVFDLDGNAVGQLQFRAGPGDMTKVITGEPSDITANSAMIKSLVESTFPVKEKGIVYSSSNEVPTIGGSDCMSVTSTDNDSAFSVRLNSLEAETDYFARAYAITSGESDDVISYGSVVEFTTMAKGVPTTVSVSPSSINFETVEYETDKKRPFTVTNTGSGVLTFQISCSNHDNVFEVANSEGDFVLNPGESTEFTVIAHGLKRFSKAECDIRILSDAENGIQIVSVSAEGWDNKPLTLASSSVVVPVGEKGQVDIIFGSMEYEIVNDNPEIVKATISTNSTGGGGRYDYWSYTYKYVNIEALASGTAALRIIDRERNEQASLLVIVGQVPVPDMVDLGLPSGTKWATCNLGASSPEDIGYHFAWGETTPKTVFTQSNYTSGQISSPNISGTEYDPAHVMLGGNWRMPTNNEMQELHDYCVLESDEEGLTAIGPNGNSIFIPMSGYIKDNQFIYKGEYGFLWVSNRYYGSCWWWSNQHTDEESPTEWPERYMGVCIRPVYNGDSSNSPLRENANRQVKRAGIVNKHASGGGPSRR